MKHFVKVIILPLWDSPAKGQKEAILRGNITLEYLRYSERMEKEIRDLIGSGYRFDSESDPRD
jgi:hypothetical protein